MSIQTRVNSNLEEKKKNATKIKASLQQLADKKFTPEYGAQFGRLERERISINKKLEVCLIS